MQIYCVFFYVFSLRFLYWVVLGLFLGYSWVVVGLFLGSPKPLLGGHEDYERTIISA